MKKQLIVISLFFGFCFPILSFAYSDYTLVKSPGDVKVYVIKNNQKRWIKNADIFNSYGFNWNNIKEISNEELSLIGDVKLIKPENDNSVFLVNSKGYKRHIANPEVFNSYGFNWNDIITINSIETSYYPGSYLIKSETDPKVYLINNKEKRWISSAEIFYKNNYNWDSIQIVNNTDLASYYIGDAVVADEQTQQTNQPQQEETAVKNNQTTNQEQNTGSSELGSGSVSQEPEQPQEEISVQQTPQLISSISLYKEGNYLVVQNTRNTIIKIKKLKVISGFTLGAFTAIIHFPNTSDNMYQYHLEDTHNYEFSGSNIINIITQNRGRNYNNLDINEIESGEIAKIDIGVSTPWTNEKERLNKPIEKVEYETGCIVEKTTGIDVPFSDINY